MSTARLDDDAALHGFAGEWRALWARIPDASPFQSPDWLLPWWNAFGTGTPRVATLRICDTLVGVLPLYLLAAEAKILPMGAGVTDQHDALLAPEAPDDAASALLAAALAGADTICDLIELPPAAALREADPPDGWRAHDAAGSTCPGLTLRAALADVPARQRRKLRMARHRADRTGAWEVRRATSADLEMQLDTLSDLHARAWQARGEAGVLADPRVQSMYRQAMPRLQQAGALRLACLDSGGEPVAACLALRAGPRMLFYLSGFDTRAAFISPGTLLLGALLEAAFAEGCTQADFLRGDEAYKYAWGAVDRFNLSRRLVRI